MTVLPLVISETKLLLCNSLLVPPTLGNAIYTFKLRAEVSPLGIL